MAMLYKNKALDINQELFTDYFNLNAIYNYDKIIIINDEELEKVLNQEKILILCLAILHIIKIWI